MSQRYNTGTQPNCSLPSVCSHTHARDRIIARAGDVLTGGRVGSQPLLSAVGHLSGTLPRRTGSSLPPMELSEIMRQLFVPDGPVTHTSPDTPPAGDRPPLLKAAPPASLWSHLCMLMLSNSHLAGVWLIDACERLLLCIDILAVWSEFVKELRWHWERRQPLPRTPHADIQFSTSCLFYQKLILVRAWLRLLHSHTPPQLNYCIQSTAASPLEASRASESPRRAVGALSEVLQHLPTPTASLPASYPGISHAEASLRGGESGWEARCSRYASALPHY